MGPHFLHLYKQIFSGAVILLSLRVKRMMIQLHVLSNKIKPHFQLLPIYYDGNFWHFGFLINNKINKHLFILFICFSKSIKKSTLNFQV